MFIQKDRFLFWKGHSTQSANLDSGVGHTVQYSVRQPTDKSAWSVPRHISFVIVDRNSIEVAVEINEMCVNKNKCNVVSASRTIKL